MALLVLKILQRLPTAQVGAGQAEAKGVGIPRSLVNDRIMLLVISHQPATYCNEEKSMVVFNQ